MDDFSLLVDLHLRNPRQGPGGDAETRTALELARVDRSRPLRVADMDCGTGASTGQAVRAAVTTFSPPGSADSLLTCPVSPSGSPR